MNKCHAFVLISIFIGGALGTIFRFTINLQVSHLIFPMGTLIENILGSFLLGTLTGYILLKKITPILKEGIGVGFCGGFTTMSTLAADAVFLASDSDVNSFLFYIATSLFGGLFVAMIGMRFGNSIVKRTERTGDME